ncbi:MAG: glycosyltransferase family 2 protein [Micromonospora sp.]
MERPPGDRSSGRRGETMAGTDVPRVSVVVPVHNTGGHLEKLVSSLLRQSLPPDQFEVIFADDGSTDDTPSRLDELAAAHPHVRVLHLPHSGWPSRPRNVGVQQARGEYVFFADDDDWFGDEALERLYDCAVRHDADIVVGRMVGHGRSVPRVLFRENRFDATLANSPLIDSLTAHKLFRRAFLDEHGLRFPEGVRRLEDHVMVTRALFLSRHTCVLAEYPCYHHSRRPDQGNATARRLDPAGYFANLREALDVVDTYTEPGALRERLHRRWLRVEMVDRLRGRRLLAEPDEWVAQVAEESRRVIRERFAPGVAAGLPPTYRLVAHLIEQGRVADLRRLAEWEAGLRARAAVERHQVTGSALTVAVSGQLCSGEEPIALATQGDLRLRLPVDAVDPELRDVLSRLAGARLDVVARRRETGEEIVLPAEAEADLASTGQDAGTPSRYRSTARLDTRTLNGGRTEGTWELRARVTSCGWTKDTRLPLTVRCAADGAPPVVVTAQSGLWARVRRAAGRRLHRLAARS